MKTKAPVEARSCEKSGQEARSDVAGRVIPEDYPAICDAAITDDRENMWKVRPWKPVPVLPTIESFKRLDDS